MKNNKKGFIAISIIYSFFILFITIMLLIMYSYVNDRKSNIKIKSELIESHRSKAPDVVFSSTGSSSPHPSYSVTIQVLDGGNGISSAKYAWSKSPTVTANIDLPSYNETISSPTEPGNYFLVVKACDVNSSCKTFITNYFAVGDLLFCVRGTALHNERCENEDDTGYCLDDGMEQGGTVSYGNANTSKYIELGDAYDCDINGDGIYDPSTERFYYINDVYNQSTGTYDRNKAVLIYSSNIKNGSANNTYTTAYTTLANYIPSTASTELTSTSQWSNMSLFNETRSISSVNYDLKYTFEYTGRPEEFVAPLDGLYKLEVWGAQGGSSEGLAEAIGGYGGYSVGTINLNRGDSLYVVVGSKGENGANNTYAKQGGYNGGGYNNAPTAKYYSAAGGGATHIATKTGVLSSLSEDQDKVVIVAGGGGGAAGISGNYGIGGPGGGQTGVTGTCYSNGGANGTGGTQTAGGYAAYASSSFVGSFGQGSSTSEGYGGAGGGGWYGGGAVGSGHTIGAGGGGSGYIGYSSLENAEMYCYACVPSAEEGMITNMTICAEETPTKQCSKKGDGYAKITYIGNGNPPEVITNSFTYTDKATRLPNYYDLETCFKQKSTLNKDGIVATKIDVIDKCKFLFENTKYSSSDLTEGYYLENPYSDNDYIWSVNAKTHSVYGGILKTSSNINGVRPVIELDKSRLQS